MKSNKVIITTTTVTLMTLFLTACGGEKLQSRSLVQSGPTSQETAGQIVSDVSESQLAELAKTQPQMKVRIVHPEHKIYEVFGVSAEDLKKDLGPFVQVHKNKFIPFKKEEKRVSVLTSLNDGTLTNVEAKAFLDSCVKNNDLEPKLQAQILLGANPPVGDLLLAKLGQTVSIDASATRSVNGKSAVQILWALEPNSDSLLGVQFQLSSKFGFKPDTYGEYRFYAFAKDTATNVCAMGQDSVFVTDNGIKFNPANAIQAADIAKVDLTRFWHLGAVGAQESWAKSEGAQVVIAVIDSGVNYNHPALAGNILVNAKEIAGNGKDDDGNGFIDDQYGYDFGNSDPYAFDDDGHGSHVAGLAASSVFGLAKKAKILPIKAGSGAGLDIASVAASIRYAVDNGAKIINLSMGMEYDVPMMKAALDYANKKNVLVIAAAGNGDAQGNGIDNDVLPIYPASYAFPNIVSVAATGIKNQLTQYSNYGLKTVDLAAPGGDEQKLMLSTYRPTPKGTGLKGQAGTSMAAPVVAGIAAQILAQKPNLLPAQVRALLMKSGQDQASLKGKTVSGKLVSAPLALQN